MALVNVRLSQDAYKGLLSLCEAHNYYNANSLSNRGISRMFLACEHAKIKWQDSRPPSLKEQDHIATIFQQARIWSEGTQKIQYSIGETAPLSYLLMLAYEHHILSYSEQNKTLRSTNMRTRVPVSNSPLSIASAVLEAIGLFYLTPLSPIPTFNPANPSMRTSSHRRALRERLGVHREDYRNN